MWFMAAMALTTIASTAMSAKGAMDQGIAGQNAANAQATAARRAAMEAEEQAKDVALQAEQDTTARMDKLASMMSGANVQAAVAGISSDSASFEALAERNKELVGRDIMTVRYNGASRASALKRQAQYSREAGESYVKAGEYARSAGEAAAIGAVFRGASSLATNAYFGSFGGGGGKTMGGAPGQPGSA